MNKETFKARTLPLLIGIFFVAAIAVFLFSVLPGPGEVATTAMLDSAAERLEMLEDTGVSRRLRPLSDSFKPDLVLDDTGAKPENAAWVSYEFLNAPSYVAKTPEEIIGEFDGKNDLTREELSLLLDAILRAQTPEAAVKRLEAHLQSHPTDAELQLYASKYFMRRNLPKRALKAQEDRFSLLLATLSSCKNRDVCDELVKDLRDAIDQQKKLCNANLLPFDSDPPMRRIVLADSGNPDLFFDYVNMLLQDKKAERASEFFDENQSRFAAFPERIATTKARILEKLGEPDRGVKLLMEHPLLLENGSTLPAALFGLLQRSRKVESWLGEMVRAVDESLDTKALRLVGTYYMRSGDYVLLEERIDRAQALAREMGVDKDGLWLLADLCERGGGNLIDRAVSLYWNYYLLVQDTQEQPKAAVALARVLIRSEKAPPVPVMNALSGAADIRFADPNPGVGGGLASLDMNMRGTGEVFSNLSEAGIKYENFRIAWRLCEPLVKKGNDPKIAISAARVLTSVLQSLQFDKAFLEVIGGFLEAYPKADGLDEFYWKLAEYYRREKLDDKELDQYEKLLSYAEGVGDIKLAASVRNRIVSRMVDMKRFKEVLPFYWKLIEREESDEALLLEFIEFCRRNNVYEDAVRAYKRAAEKFNTSLYSDKLARFYLQNKEYSAFKNLTETLGETLGEDDLLQYLNGNINYHGKWQDSETVFYEKMYLLALKRFPYNRQVLDRLLRFYRYFDDKHGAALNRQIELLMRYFATDPELGKELCRTLALDKKLNSLLGDVLDEKTVNPVQLHFAAHGLGFVSRYESQYEVAKMLADRYRDPDWITATAGLERSLDSSYFVEDSQLSIQAASRYLLLADRHPLEMKYSTLAGEVQIEAGLVKSADKSWERILNILPGDKEPYLHLATVYWDYYLFGHALGVISQGRKRTKDPLLLAKEMGYLFESMGNKEKAIDQYVQSICKGKAQWETRDRLAYLENRPELQKYSATALEKVLMASDATGRDVINFASYLESNGRNKEKLELYEKNIDRFDQEDFLRNAAEYFGGMGRQDLAEKAMERYANVAGRSTDVLLTLLNFYQSNRSNAKVLALCDELLALNGAGFPRQKEILRRVANERWIAGSRVGSLEAYRQLMELEKGEAKDRLAFEYARKNLEAGFSAEGAALLESLIEKDPFDSRYEQALARHYSENGSYQALANLYRKTIERVKKSKVSRDRKKELLVAHRRNLAQALVKLNQNTEALDNLIEVQNLEAPNRDITDEIYRFAQARNLVDRLVEYYEKLAEKSFKDYRWQMVLGGLRDRMGMPEQAAQLYAKAVSNEPQMLFLHDMLINALVRAGQDDQALAAMERKYDISGADDDLERLAELAFATGDTEKATKILLSIIAPDKTSNYRLFEVAEMFEDQGLVVIADQVIDRAAGRFIANPLNFPLFQEQMAKIAIAKSRVGDILAGFEYLIGLREKMGAKADNAGKVEASQYRMLQNRAMYALTIEFAMNAGDTASVQDLQLVENRLIDLIESDLKRALKTDQMQDFPIYNLTQFAENIHSEKAKDRILTGSIEFAEDIANYNSRKYRKKNTTDQYVAYLRENGRAADALDALNTWSYAEYFPKDIRRGLAELSHLNGKDQAEIDALHKIFEEKYYDGFSKPDSYRMKFLLKLFDNSGNDLARLAQNTKRPGEVVGFAAWKKDRDIAFAALDAGYSRNATHWINRRKIQVLEYLKDPKSALPYYESILGTPRRIGAMLSGDEDHKLIVTHDRWFFWAHRFGAALLQSKDERAGKYMLSLAEKSPRDAASYVEAAMILAKAGEGARAEKVMDQAASLAPTSQYVQRSLGDMYLILGRKDQGANAYRKILEMPGADLDDYRHFVYWMEKGGMADRAVPVYIQRLKRDFTKLPYWQKEDELDDAAKMIKEPKAFADLCRELVNAIAAPEGLIEAILRRDDITEKEKTWFYKRGADMALASTGFSTYAKVEWQQRLYEQAVEIRDKALGDKAIEEMLRLDPQGWDEVEINEYRTRLEAASLDEKKRHLPLIAFADSCTSSRCFEKARAVAGKFGAKKALHAIDFRRLKHQLIQGWISLPDRIELARLYFEFGEPEKGARHLEYAAIEAGGQWERLLEIADVYIENGKPEQARGHLEMARRIRPEAWQVQGRLALVAALTGDMQSGAEQIAGQLTKGEVPRSKIEQQTKTLLDSLDANNALTQFTDVLAGQDNDGAKLLLGLIHLRNGDEKAAEQSFADVKDSGFYFKFITENKILALAQSGKRKALVAAIDDARVRFGNRRSWQILQMAALAEQGRFAEALEAVQSFLPTRVYYLNLPTDTFANYGSAKDYIESLGATEDETDQAAYLTADCFTSLGFPDEALTYLQALKEIIERRKNDSAALREVNRRIEKTKAALGTAQKLTPPWPEITQE